MGTKQKQAVESYIYKHLIDKYPKSVSTFKVVGEVRSQFGNTDRNTVVACLADLSNSNLVVSSIDDQIKGWVWTAVWYRTADSVSPQQKQNQKTRIHQQSAKPTHRITRHVSEREMREEILAYFTEGPSYAYTTGDITDYCEEIFGDNSSYGAVTNALKDLAGQNLIASFRTTNVHGYRWYLTEGIEPLLEELRPHIMEIVKTNGNPDSQFIVDHIRWDMNRRVRYGAVTAALKTLAREGLLVSHRPEDQRHYRWSFPLL